jgi:hypothetical protein
MKRKIALPVPPEGKSVILWDQNILTLIQANLKLYEELHIPERDIEASYNSLYKFYFVSVFKNCDSGPGNGTSASRDANWSRVQVAIENLFDIEDKSITWRWANHYNWQYPDPEALDTPKPYYIPGFKYTVNSLSESPL